MNILTDVFPDAVIIDGVAVQVDTSYRTCLLIILAFEDAELTDQEKMSVLLHNLYDKVPENIEDAVKQGIKFLDGGEEAGEGEGQLTQRLYSFNKDARFIYSAFMQTHGIDLAKEDLHWWKFLALFLDLGADTVFSNIVSLRKRLADGKATKEERAAAREMHDILDLPEQLTQEEKELENRFMEQLGK
jgi:hypothetical protein